MMVFRRAIAPILTVAIVLGTGVLGPGSAAWADVAEERDDAIAELNTSQEIFQEIATDPDTQIPASLVQESRAIIIVSNIAQGGFIVGGRRGDGLMVVRQANGSWSEPAFLSMGGGSFGLQFGGRSSDLIMLVMDQEVVMDILEGDVEFGGTVTGTAGPVGATVADPAAADGDILLYSRSSGLFGGATLEGSTIEFDEDRNAAFYSTPNITASQIFTNQDLTPAISTREFKQTLQAAE